MRKLSKGGPAPLRSLACTGCGETKLRAKFYTRSKNGQVIQPCRECAKAQSRAKPTPPDVKRRSRIRNAESIAKYQRKYVARPEHKARRNAALRARLKADPRFAIERALRRCLADHVRHALTRKSASAFALLGCSTEQFLKHLETRFQSGMSWTNWGRGRGKWHIDHRKPIAAFDLRDPQEQQECFHHTNLQPLWQEENLRKGAFFSEGMCGV